MDDERGDISRIKELLKKEPRGMSIRQITDQLPINRNLVAKYLDMLLVSGQVEMRSFGMAKIYYLSHRVPISAMMDFASDFIVVLDENLRIIQINDNFLTFSNMSRDGIMGKTIGEETLPLLASESSLAAVREALRGKKTRDNITYSRDGTASRYNAKFIPTVFESGAPGVTVILEDTTEIWLAERTLRSALLEKNILLRDINQRINNNLQLVQSFIALQMASLPEGPVRDVLRETQNRITALALVYGQLGTAHPGSIVELGMYLKHFVTALTASFGIPEDTISVTTESPEPGMTEEKVMATGLVLNELISYLLGNLVRDPVQPAIRISVTRDTGKGYLFRMEYAGLPFPAPEIGSVNVLGLQIAYMLVTKQLGGTIALTEDRHGFIITIPPE